MIRKIIIPKWETLASKDLLSIVQGKVCIRKIVFTGYLKRNNPGDEEFIDSILRNWSSNICLTQEKYKIFRISLKNRPRRFSDGQRRIIV